MAEVSLERVRKEFAGGRVAVDDADFEIAAGELLVLVGPSGCGKTTTLRLIAGLEQPTAGTIRIGGRVVNALPPAARDIAMVFQSYALYPHMSVAENLAFGLEVRGLPRADIERRIRAAADMLGLGDMLALRPAQLSGGQRQRVALGRALVREPRVFLLDEPLSNLDAKLRMSMRVEIARLHRRLGATMVYVTHDQVEAMTLGRRVVVFDGGRIQQIDTPMEVYARPANLFVAGFFGSPAMNLLRGRLLADDGGRLQLQGAALPLRGVDLKGALRGYLGRELVIGLRPEDLQPQTHGAGYGPAVDVHLELVEAVGSESFVYTRLGQHALVARVPPAALAVNGARTLTLGYAARRLHFFDPASGLRIEPADRETAVSAVPTSPRP